MKPTIEILAPAGSFESMKAAIQAGADAVYMGGAKFGARAYADNPDQDRYLEAIDFVHLHGKQIYMTVNTLLRDEEIKSLSDYIKPYYQQGLDAVIVQDLGVLSQLKKVFSDLPIHASTQMSIMGYHGAKMLKELGASRIVTARELSLDEIRKIHKEIGIEIESFVHGALCYGYSGQCLMSSLIGGRSANRGRCAQPCRLPYRIDGKQEQYLLNMKDLCALDYLPEIIEAGVYSLKIEGRMKGERYTAGVVSMYRKYVDRYFTYGKKGYYVEDLDKKMLLDLFDRGGFTSGYSKMHNDKSMISVKEKPTFRQGNQKLFDELDETYIRTKKQIPIYGSLTIKQGEALKFYLSTEDGTISTQIIDDVILEAKNQPATKEAVATQIKKTGTSDFYFYNLEILIEGQCFLPVQLLKKVRRTGLEQLKEKILESYRRNIINSIELVEEVKNRETNTTQWELYACVETKDQFKAVLSKDEVNGIYLDSSQIDEGLWSKFVKQAKDKHKKCFLVFPQVFRKEAQDYFVKNKQQLLQAKFDGCLIRSLETISFLKEQGIDLPIILDGMLYAMNQEAYKLWKGFGVDRITLPFELNGKQLEALNSKEAEMVIYGRYPIMISAQCILKNTSGCRKTSQTLMIKDRINKEIPVKNHCKFCYNTLYNPDPLSLIEEQIQVKKISPKILRMQFSIETYEETLEITQSYIDGFIKNQKVKQPIKAFTKGHLRRGVE